MASGAATPFPLCGLNQPLLKQGEPLASALLAEREGHVRLAWSQFDQGCKGGDPEFCFCSAWALSNQGKLEAAAELARKACLQGHHESCSFEGAVLAKMGRAEESVRLYKEGCDAGSARGCVSLANHEENAGRSAEADVLYRKACDLGPGPGCASLADFKWNERMQAAKGQAYETADLQPLKDKACESGSFDYCEITSQNYRAMKRLLGSACDHGFRAACRPMLDAAVRLGTARDVKAAIHALCSRSNTRCYAAGYLSKEEYEKAIAGLKKQALWSDEAAETHSARDSKGIHSIELRIFHYLE